MRTPEPDAGIRVTCPAPRWLRCLARVLCACGGLAVVAVGARAMPVEVLSTFSQFYGLSREQSAEGRPIRIEGVVLCYDLDWGQLYVHDGSQVRWFDPREISTQPTNGQVVEITGITAVVENVNALTNLNLTVLKQGTLPAARRLAVGQLTNELGQWVETSGHVRAVDFDGGRMQFSVYTGGQGCQIYVMGPAQTGQHKRLLGAQVRVRGINASKMADGRLKLASLFVSGLDEIAVIEPPDDRETLPRVMSIDSLLNRELGDWTNHLVRLSGTVVTFEPGTTLIVQDQTGVIRARVIQQTPARSDDRVEVCGFLRVTPEETILSGAWFQVIKPAALPAAAPVAANLPVGGGRRREVLTQVSEVRKLRIEESTLRWPVRLRGVVLYADPEWRNGYLQDQRGSVYFDLGQSHVRAGQWAELTGETGPGGFAPEILNASVEVLGTTNFPAAAKVDLGDLAGGLLDAQWVEMEGVIRRVHLEWGHMTLSVMTPKGKFNALIPGLHDQTAPTDLIDALVSIQGACSLEVNARRQVTGVTLNVPGLDRINILEPAPTDPFAVAATPIAAVATFDPDRITGRRVKVTGAVTLKSPDQGFFMQDDSGGIWVHLPRLEGIEVGDVLDVLGFPAFGEFSPELDEIDFRRTGDTAHPVARGTTAADILMHGADDGVVVTLEARLLQNVPRSANPQLLLQDGAIFFTARLEDAAQGLEMPAFRSGSVVRLSGVCSILRGEQREPKGFRLRMRSPAEVTLISSPPWWSTRHTYWVVGGLGGVLVMVLAWVRALRGHVARHTRTLREQITERERMQVQIEKSHKELLHASRQAGMAEIASNVLHSVGNVLNSLNVSSGVVMDRVKQSKVTGLGKVVTLLQEHEGDAGAFISRDPRGKRLPAYLAQLSALLLADQAETLKELESLQGNVTHIKAIVAMQQNYAKLSGFEEISNVRELVEDCLRMNVGSFGRHGVEVVREYEEVPPMVVQRHRVLQIVMDLVGNAKHACDDSGRADKRVTVRVANDTGRVRISVADNGVGIPAENLMRIFNHGFTTRKHGHGFGLHSAALAAKEMGGALSVHSAGPGMGATFTLELPCPEQESNHA